MLTKSIEIGGLTLQIAPTPIVHLAAVERHFADKTIETREGRADLIEACFYGIRRTRKECPASGGITPEWLQENVDVNTMGPLFKAFSELNFPAPVKGDAAPGEAQAGAGS